MDNVVFYQIISYMIALEWLHINVCGMKKSVFINLVQLIVIILIVD